MIAKFDKNFIGETNETCERYLFNKSLQESDESIDIYVTALRNLSKTCNFCECLHDSLIREQIVMGVRDNAIRKQLLQEKKLTLNTCIDICRSAKATASQLKAMSGPCQCDANKVKSKHSSFKDIKKKQVDKKFQKPETKQKENSCKFCGYLHVPDKLKCPTWIKSCSLPGEILLLRNAINLAKFVLYKNLIFWATQRLRRGRDIIKGCN